MIIAALIFWVLAAGCNAVMDTLTHHYYNSIFNKYNTKWWNPQISWRNKYIDGDPEKGIDHTKLVWFSDAWHLFKSIMITLLCLSITFALHSNQIPAFTGKYNLKPWVVYMGVFCATGIIWNLVFSLLYNRILKRKTTNP